MPTWLDSIFTRVDATTRAHSEREHARQIAAFRAELAEQARIRLYVGSGSRAATANVLRRLVAPVAGAGLTHGYAGTVEVHHEQDALDDLRALLPELGDADAGQIAGATVELLACAASPPAEALGFGFTGAVNGDQRDLAAALNVRCFLQLQPYDGAYGEVLWFADEREAVRLREVELLDAASFARRMVYVPPASYAEPDWQRFADVEAQIVRYLTGDEVLGAVRLVVSRTIARSGRQGTSSESDGAAAVLCGGVLDWQRGGHGPHAAPVVVLDVDACCTRADEGRLQRVASLLAGGATADEEATLPRGGAAARAHFDARRDYMRTLESAARFDYVTYPQSLEPVRTRVEAFGESRDRVLLVRLGRLPPPLYGYLLSKTNFFSVFDDSSSLMAAVNTGKPFLALSRPGKGVSPALYPTVTRGWFSASPPIGALAGAANQLEANLEIWPSRVASNPCRVLGDLLRQIAGDDVRADPIRRYFAELRATCARSEHDKLDVALAYLMTRASAPGQELAAGATADSDSGLEALYEKLAAQVVIGQQLDLVPGVLAGGNVEAVVLGILKGYDASLWLEVATFEHQRDQGGAVSRITLTGTTGVFRSLAVTNALSIVFDAPDGALRTTLRFASEGAWAIPDAPWLRMSAPYLELTVSAATLPVAARLGGTCDSLGAELSVLVPVTERQWLGRAELVSPYPGVDRAFQMAAGINLVRVLPPPLDALADLGLARVELHYDSERRAVASLGFAIRRQGPQPTPLKLLGDIALDDVAIDVALVEPASERRVEAIVSGRFTIGQGERAGIVTVTARHPNFQFTGSLTSGEIALADLIDAFVPGVTLDLPGLPKITELGFSYTHATDALSVSVALGVNWPFVILGQTLFELENVRFAIARASGVNHGFVLGEMTILPKAPIGLSVGAYYEQDAGWTFVAKQTGSPPKLEDLLSAYLGPVTLPGGVTLPTIEGLALTVAWRDGAARSWEFTAEASGFEIPFDSGLRVGGRLHMGDHGDDGDDGAGPFARVSTELQWRGIDVGIACVYREDASVYELRVNGFKGELEHKSVGKEGKHWVATVGFADDTTLGGLVGSLVSWATGSTFGLAAPWNLLDSIRLSEVKLTYDLTGGTVGFAIEIGPIELGFARITAIGLTYEAPEGDAKRKVMVRLDGSFAFNVGRADEPIEWDATDPESTPAPPGGGNKYLDVRLLAMGQHVAVPDIETAESVPEVIARLRGLPRPEAGKVPPVRYAADSQWLIGADLRVLKIDADADENAEAGGGKSLVPTGDEGDDGGYVLTVQMVFNDPRLYALRVALAGEQAKIFAGLDFQVMYRRISDTLGVYQAEITLPSAMRRLDVGAYTVTLPVFGIEVYTDGGFKLDIGFPWHEDFSRSFSVEGIVPPGLPLVGAGGFYLGKLAEAAVPELPRAINGSFDPVLVFGFGAQLGLGKSIEAGVLKAGFRLTVFGIVEGVLAKWNPHLPTETGNSASQQLQGQFYFSLSGTLGIIGQLYGTIDFAILKADVRVEVKLYAQISVASYQPIPISVVASVDVHASVRISLGLFHITLHFSFSMRLKQTFTIENGGQAPWRVAGPAAEGLLAAPLSMRLRDGGAPGAELLSSRLTRPPDWAALRAPEAPAALTGYCVPGLTVAGDEAIALTDQLPCYVVALFLESAPPAGEDDAGSRAKAAGEAEDTSFEVLCKLVARWGVVAQKRAAVMADAADDLVVGAKELRALLGHLSRSSSNPTPIPAEAVEAFLASQVKLTLHDPKAKTGDGTALEIDGAFFPMPPGLRLVVPEYAGQPGFAYRFADFNAVSDTFLDELSAYFAQLAVQVAREDAPPARAETLSASTGGGRSIASFVFADYFVLLMRQMVQAMLDGLRDYKYPIAPQERPADVVAWVNEHQRAPGEKAGVASYTLHDLLAANVHHTLTAGKALTIGGARHRVMHDQTFASIAGDTFAGAFDAAALATLNADRSGVLRGGAEVHVDGAEATINEGDTIASLARRLGSSADALIAAGAVLTADVLAPLTEVLVPDYPYVVRSGDTLTNVVARHGVTLEDIAREENGEVTDLFSPEDDGTLDLAHLTRLRVGALLAEAQRTRALQHLSGMASRYYFHGLRLPTRDIGAGGGRIEARARGMWVREHGDPGEAGHHFTLPEEAGLFALTGQQVPLPRLEGDEAFVIELSRQGGPGWIALPAGETYTIAVTAGSEDARRIDALRDHAHAHRLDLETTGLAARSPAASHATTYPLVAAIDWSSPEAIALPGGSAGQRVTIFALPEALLALPGPTRRLDPRFALRVHRYEEASGATRVEPVSSHAWLSIAAFTVKRVPLVARSPTSAATYEISGASARDVVVLERLLERIGGDDEALATVTIAFSAPPIGGTSGLQTPAASSLTIGIGQANLSTQTHPPDRALRMKALTATAPPGPTLLNGKAELVRLLWEAGITRTGGFYLYYHDAASGEGLPERIFNDKGEATVTLIAVHRPDDGAGRDRLTADLNAVVVGDALDLSRATLVAQAERERVDVATDALPDLATLAHRHFANVADIANDAANGALRLRPGVTVSVRNGRYQVSPTGAAPAGRLAEIAAHFGSDVEAIKAANPSLTASFPASGEWPDPLQAYTVLHLPALDVTVGSGPGGDTLAGIATHFGVSRAGLASHNAFTAELFAPAQTLVVAAGPTVRASSSAPGIEELAAERPVPPAAGPPMLAQADAIGGEALPGNHLRQTFSLLGARVWANQDFAGSGIALPAGPQSESPAGAGKVRAPAARGAGDRWLYRKSVPFTAFSTRPGSESPYRGNGALLQVDLAWHDLYGNRIITTLSHPQVGDAGPVNRAPMLIGYTDSLVALGQWPSVSSSWTVTPARDGGQPTLAVVLDFSPDAFLASEDGGSTHWQENAKRAAPTLERIVQQLGDPCGVSVRIETTLLAEPLALSGEQSSALLAWVEAIEAFVAARLEGEHVKAPDRSPAVQIATSIDPATVTTAQVFRVSLDVAIERRGVVDGELETTPGVRRTRTRLAPGGGGADALVSFARDFSAALSLPDSRLEIAVGVDRMRASAGASPATIWAVRIGPQAIHYSVRSATEGTPARIRYSVFAPRPIANQLISRSDVPIAHYGAEGIDLVKPDAELAFRDVDMDVWGAQLFAAVDELLAPAYTSAMLLVDERTTRRSRHVGGYLGELLELKKALAGIVAEQLIPVYQDAPAPTERESAAVREAFRQELLVTLGNAYATRAAVSFVADVAAEVQPDPCTTAPPQLYGTFTGKMPGEVSLTATRLVLETTKPEDPAPLALLLSAPRQVREQGAVLPEVTLEDLVFDASAIEHQIGKVEGIEDYQASSWLRLVDPDGAGLAQELGAVTVPLVLRSFPTTPSMTSQSGEGAHAQARTLADLTRWSYTFTYARDFHYPQDRVHAEVRFNVSQTAAQLLAGLEDAFDALAQFVTAYPQVKPDLTGVLAGLDVDSDQASVDRAAVALGAFNAMVSNVVLHASGAGLQVLAGQDSGSHDGYDFTIEESIETVAGQELSLVVTVSGAPPAGVSAPSVSIGAPGAYTSKLLSSGDGAWRYCFEDTEGRIVPASLGQTVRERTVVIGDLQILARQDAWASIRLRRNEALGNREIAEPFVYTTTRVRFANEYRPTIRSSQSVDIATVGTRDGEPVTRPLAAHLQALFDALLGNTADGSATIALEACYEYPLSPALTPVALPVLMQPPLTVERAAKDATMPAAKMVEELAAGIDRWFAATRPVAAGGQLRIALTCMSSTMSQPMPLLRLENLALAVERVEPALATRGAPIS